MYMMKNTTTIEIPKKRLEWWRNCCKIKNMKSAELFDSLVIHIQNKKRQEFYLSLPMPNDFRKPLTGKKIDKNYRK